MLVIKARKTPKQKGVKVKAWKLPDPEPKNSLRASIAKLSRTEGIKK